MIHDTAAPLHDRYARLKEEATLLAGDLLDIPRRAVLLYHLYRDSGGNHDFPLMAAHGALWGYSYFEVGGALGRLIGRRYFYDPKERAYRLGLLNEYAEAFRRVNRQVCIDTWTNYHFVKEYGRAPGAEQIVPAPLLDALNRVHDARRSVQRLPPTARRLVFEQSFRCEQEVTVAPAVRAAVDAFDCRIMRALSLKPLVRFAYFPGREFLFFRDFADKAERIAKGMYAYELAERVSWEHVQQTLADYGIVPPRHLAAPDVALGELGYRPA